MTVKGGTSQACAACKYQRRRCTPDCPLAPYFPADKPKMFQNAHRLFGVCNIMKILKQLRDDQKEEAMKSIIYESDMRERFPVYGCSLVIWQLREQLRQYQEELYYVNSLLAALKSKEPCQNPDLANHYTYSSKYHVGVIPTDNYMSLNEECYDNDHYQQYESTTDLTLVPSQDFMGEETGFVESDDNMVKSLWMQQSHFFPDNYPTDMKPNLMGLSLHQQVEVSHEYDMAFDTVAEDRNSCDESKEAFESSAESALESIDTTSQNQNHHLSITSFY